ncbi:MAG: transposase [Proteobacteria bacterium]|nr:transposase [Pseudomonadota bacterium]
MMGQLPADQSALFYDFCLDDYIPQNHFLRQIDRILDLSELRRHLAPFYSHTGRPSIDPELIIRMLIIAYCFGIRSERRLCEEVHLNLAYRWFCRLGLEEQVPEHSTFSKNRHGRFRESDTLRFVFEQVLGHCIERGLVGGEGFAIDASIIAADANCQRGVGRDEVIDWGETNTLTRPVREYLDRLDADNNHKTPPKKVSLTDPAAQWTAARGGPAYFAYSTNYLIDIDAGIIVDVEATPAHRTDEVNATRTMIDRTEGRFKLKPHRLIGDTAYGTAEMLEWMVEEKAITPHIPVWDKSGRTDGSFSRTDFIFDDKANEYRCPQGKTLRTTGRVTVDNTRLYRASYYDCINCPDKYRCCPNTPSRKIARSVHEAARDRARDLAKTPEYQQSMKDRKKVEMLFAHLKRILKLDRLRLRGLSGAHDEFLLAATAQNLRRMAKWCGHDPPNTAIGMAV